MTNPSPVPVDLALPARRELTRWGHRKPWYICPATQMHHGIFCFRAGGLHREPVSERALLDWTGGPPRRNAVLSIRPPYLYTAAMRVAVSNCSEKLWWRMDALSPSADLLLPPVMYVRRVRRPITVCYMFVYDVHEFS